MPRRLIAVLAAQAAVCLTGMSVSPTSYGANSGWFGGIRLTSPELNTASVTVVERTSLNLFWRYPIRLKWDMEIGATEPVQLGRGAGLRPPASRKQGWQVLGVGTMPLSKSVGLFGKLGAYQWGAETNPTIAGLSETEPQPTYGLGLKYDLTRNLSVSGEWDRYRLGPNSGVPADSDIDLLSVGLKYRF